MRNGSKRSAAMLKAVTFGIELTDSVSCITKEPFYRVVFFDGKGNRNHFGVFATELDAKAAIDGAKHLLQMTAIDVEYGRCLAR